MAGKENCNREVGIMSKECKECGHDMEEHRFDKCQKMLGFMGTVPCDCKFLQEIENWQSKKIAIVRLE